MYRPAHGIVIRAVSWRKTVGQGKCEPKETAGKSETAEQQRQKVKVLHQGVLRAAGVRVRLALCLAAHHIMGEGSTEENYNEGPRKAKVGGNGGRTPEGRD
ncbi:unnamed protein product [Ectocarpus sp. 6 AP-2014]